jgi:hypothetical protein
MFVAVVRAHEGRELEAAYRASTGPTPAGDVNLRGLAKPDRSKRTYRRTFTC